MFVNKFFYSSSFLNFFTNITTLITSLCYLQKVDDARLDKISISLPKYKETRNKFLDKIKESTAELFTLMKNSGQKNKVNIFISENVTHEWLNQKINEYNNANPTNKINSLDEFKKYIEKRKMELIIKIKNPPKGFWSLEELSNFREKGRDLLMFLNKAKETSYVKMLLNHDLEALKSSIYEKKIFMKDFNIQYDKYFAYINKLNKLKRRKILMNSLVKFFKNEEEEIFRNFTAIERILKSKMKTTEEIAYLFYEARCALNFFYENKKEQIKMCAIEEIKFIKTFFLFFPQDLYDNFDIEESEFNKIYEKDFIKNVEKYLIYIKNQHNTNWDINEIIIFFQSKISEFLKIKDSYNPTNITNKIYLAFYEYRKNAPFLKESFENSVLKITNKIILEKICKKRMKTFKDERKSFIQLVNDFTSIIKKSISDNLHKKVFPFIDKNEIKTSDFTYEINNKTLLKFFNFIEKRILNVMYEYNLDFLLNWIGLIQIKSNYFKFKDKFGVKALDNILISETIIKSLDSYKDIDKEIKKHRNLKNIRKIDNWIFSDFLFNISSNNNFFYKSPTSINNFYNINELKEFQINKNNLSLVLEDFFIFTIDVILKYCHVLNKNIEKKIFSLIVNFSDFPCFFGENFIDFSEIITNRNIEKLKNIIKRINYKINDNVFLDENIKKNKFKVIFKKLKTEIQLEHIKGVFFIYFNLKMNNLFNLDFSLVNNCFKNYNNYLGKFLIKKILQFSSKNDEKELIMKVFYEKVGHIFNYYGNDSQKFIEQPFSEDNAEYKYIVVIYKVLKNFIKTFYLEE